MLHPSERLLVGIALMPVAVLLVHEIRYLLAFGDATGSVLADRGHGYLGQLIPPLALVSALALGGFLAQLGQAWQTGTGGRSPHRTLLALWLLTFAGLLGIYAGQEMLEALLTQGRQPSVAVVFGAGGLWAVPLSLLIGLLLALVLRGAAQVVDLFARLGRRERARPCTNSTIGSPRPASSPALDPMARSAPGRAPPRVPVHAFRRRPPAVAHGC